MAATQNQFGSLIFCSRCGTLLDLPGDEDQLVCDGCGQVEDAGAYEGKVITTKSNPAAFPSSLRQLKTSLVKDSGDVEKKKVYVDETCEKCGEKQMSVKTMQLRSADEGATVFYSCEKCGYQTRLNN
ncbi:DNA-directed RNA polymerase I core subunit rpa12 [Rhodotorula kratochvilovae]